MGKQQHVSTEEQSAQTSNPNQPMDVKEGTYNGNQLNEADMDVLSDMGDITQCPYHNSKLNQTEDPLNNPIDGKKAQDQLFECGGEV